MSGENKALHRRKVHDMWGKTHAERFGNGESSPGGIRPASDTEKLLQELSASQLTVTEVIADRLFPLQEFPSQAPQVPESTFDSGTRPPCDRS